MKNNFLVKQLQQYLEGACLQNGPAPPTLQVLQEYLDASSWKELDEQQRQLLGEAFLSWGEWQLMQATHSALQRPPEPPTSFAAAAALLPGDPFVLMRQAVAYVKYSEELALWKLAMQYVENALDLLPMEFLVYRLAGQIMERIGEREADATVLEGAYLRYKEAQALCDPASSDYLGILWEMGKVAYNIGKFSGEANDFYRAIAAYRTAEQLGEQSLLFLIDFGHAYQALGGLLSREELLVTALTYYQRAVENGPTHPEAQLQLACHAQQLYESYNREEYYSTAATAFKEACSYFPEDPLVCCKQAMLLAIHGKRSSQTEQLSASLELFEKAHKLDPSQSIILTRWAEVLLAYGVETERYELLRLSTQKMELALQLTPQHSEVWAMYGYCLNELGNYFGDELYHRQAIEKFQNGLQIDPTNSKLLHGLALAYLSVGALRSEQTLFEQAERLFQRVAEFDSAPSPDFWVDWGIALMRLGEVSMTRSYVADAVEKFELAIKLFSEQPLLCSATGLSSPPLDWLYNYGCALDFLGDFDDDPAHYEHAIRLLSSVVECDPSFTNARYNLALALSHLGELVADVDCFYLAAEQFKCLLESDPEDGQAWEEWGSMLLHQAILMHEPARPIHSDELFYAAEQKLLQAVSLGSSGGLYTIACLYSLRGNYEAGMRYILRACDANALPPIDDLMHDEWLEGLRSQPTFRRLLLELAKEKAEG